jgi:hypothetical protein
MNTDLRFVDFEGFKITAEQINTAILSTVHFSLCLFKVNFHCIKVVKWKKLFFFYRNRRKNLKFKHTYLNRFNSLKTNDLTLS